MNLFKTLLAGLFSLALVSPAYSAGTIFGLPLSQQLDSSGNPIVAGKLYLYEADTTTPVSVYEDFGLSTETSNPLETDASGRIPEFWLDNGSYRARFTTSGGVVVFDILNTTAIGASSGEGGSGSTVSQNSVFTTGMVTWLPVNSTKTGWVRANGRTIGSAASGATERANADTQPLYEWLWNNCSNTNCPVSSGRGASASADFAANKTIGTLDLRGRGVIGLDTMGNSAASVVAAATTEGNAAGAETATLAEENLPAHVHDTGTYEVGSHTHTGPSHTHTFSGTGSTSTDGNHTHTYTRYDSRPDIAGGGSVDTWSGQNTGVTTSSSGSHNHSVTVSGTTNSSGTGNTGSTKPTFTGESGSVGSGTAFSTMDPHRPGTWFIRL